MATDTIAPSRLRLRNLLRSEALSSECAETRNRERLRRAALASLSSALNKALSLGTSLISVPLTVRYLDPERYGLWLALSSALAFLAFADFGMGNGLLNETAHSLGRNDKERMKIAVASSFFSLGALALVILLAIPSVLPHLPLARLLGARSTAAAREVNPAAAVLVACFAVNLPFDVVQRVQTGLQLTFSSNLWRCGGSLLGLGLLLSVVHLKLGIPALLLAALGAPVISTAANFVFFFAGERPDLRPNLSNYRSSVAIRMCRQGVGFLAAQAGAAILTAAPTLLTARLLGDAAAAVTGVTQRMFLIPYSICEFFWSPLWAAYGEAWAGQDNRFIRRTFRSTTLAAVASMTLMVAGIAFFSSPILRVWTRGAISAQMSLVAAVGALMFVRVFRGALSAPLNGCGFLLRSAMLLAAAAGGVLAFPALSNARQTPERIVYFILGLEALVALGMWTDVRRILSIGADTRGEPN